MDKKSTGGAPEPNSNQVNIIQKIRLILWQRSSSSWVDERFEGGKLLVDTWDSATRDSLKSRPSNWNNSISPRRGFMRVGYVGARQRKIITKIIFCVVPSCNNQLRILINGAKSITWVKELKYLELYFVSSKKFTIDVSVAIKRFYFSENAIFAILNMFQSMWDWI